MKEIRPENPGLNKEGGSENLQTEKAVESQINSLDLLSHMGLKCPISAESPLNVNLSKKKGFTY